MKTYYVCALFVMLQIVIIADSVAQTAIGPDTSDYRKELFRNEDRGYYMDYDTSITHQSRIGLWLSGNAHDTCYSYYQWMLPSELIPDGSEIDSVRLQAKTTAAGSPASFALSRLAWDIRSTWRPALWESTKVAPRYNEQEFTNNHFDRTYRYGVPGDSLVYWVRQRLSSHVFGIAFWTGLTQNYKLLSDSVLLTIWLHPMQNTVFEKFDDNNGFQENGWVGHLEGSIAWYELNPVTSSYPFWVNVKSWETFYADSLKYHENASPYSEGKYHKWEGYNDGINPRGFQMLPADPHQVARFTAIHGAMLQSQLMDNDSLGGQLQFTDPWFRDSTNGNLTWNRGPDAIPQWVPYSYANLGTNSDHQGVFLNEGYPNWSPPYYSVGAPLNQTIGLFSSYFQYWTVEPGRADFRTPSKDTTALVFTQAGATVTAKYKAHLVSTNQFATGPNGQRKVVTYGSSSHAVYESAGCIFYMRNDGSGWGGEQLISRPTRTAKNPSVAAAWFSTNAIFVHIAWEEQDSVTLQWKIMYRHSENNGASFSESLDNPHYIGDGHEPVCAGDNEGAVAWRADNGQLYFRHEPSRTDVMWSVAVPDADSASELSLAGHGNTFYLSFIQGGGVRLKKIAAYWYPAACDTFFESENPVSQYSWVTDCRRTNVTALGNIMVSWDALGNGVVGIPPDDPQKAGVDGAGTDMRRIFTVERTPSGWGYLAIFSTGTSDNTSPSLGIDARPSVNKAYMLWQAPSDGIAQASRNLAGWNYLWSWATILDNGKVPTADPYICSSSDTRWQMWTGLTGSLYPVVLTDGGSSRPGLQQAKGTLTPSATGAGRISRQATIRLDSLMLGQPEPGAVTGDLVVNCQRFKVTCNGVVTPLDFSSDSTTNENWLGTVATVVPENADQFSGTIGIALRKFEVVKPDLPLNTPVMTLGVQIGGNLLRTRTITLSDLARLGVQDTVVWFHISVPANGLRGKTVAFRQQLIGQDVKMQPAWSELTEFDSISTHSQALVATASAGTQQSQLPTVFALHQNFPNPFNPATELRFDLPEAGNVSLVLYDVLGREVANLVSGYHEGGYHRATWNASGQASGVYFARFSVINGGGVVAYTKVNKLMLVR